MQEKMLYRHSPLELPGEVENLQGRVDIQRGCTTAVT